MSEAAPAVQVVQGHVCSICGYSPSNRANWCDLGCGRDYQRMIRVESRRATRLRAACPAGQFPCARSAAIRCHREAAQFRWVSIFLNAVRRAATTALSTRSTYGTQRTTNVGASGLRTASGRVNCDHCA